MKSSPRMLFTGKMTRGTQISRGSAVLAEGKTNAKASRQEQVSLPTKRKETRVGWNGVSEKKKAREEAGSWITWGL